MADDKQTENLKEYEQHIDDSKLSNPFSNALKNFSALLQKMHLIKSDQTLIGDKDTNSRGFQTTSRSVESVTDRRSLTAILRRTFENIQNKRAERIQASNNKNTLQKQTIGQANQAEQTKDIKDMQATQTKDIIRPRTASEKAAQAQPASTIINNTVNLDKAEVKPKEENTIEGISAEEIEVDKTFDSNKDRNSDQSENNSLETVDLNVAKTQQNQIIMPKVKSKESVKVENSEKSEDELSK